MKFGIGELKFIVTSVSIVLSFATAYFGMKYKKSKKEMLNFLFDIVLMIVGNLLTFNVFGVLYNVVVMQCKYFIGVKEAAELLTAKKGKYKKIFTVLVYVSIASEFFNLFFEIMTKAMEAK